MSFFLKETIASLKNEEPVQKTSNGRGVELKHSSNKRSAMRSRGYSSQVKQLSQLRANSARRWATPFACWRMWVEYLPVILDSKNLEFSTRGLTKDVLREPAESAVAIWKESLSKVTFCKPLDDARTKPLTNSYSFNLERRVNIHHTIWQRQLQIFRWSVFLKCHAVISL